MFNDNPGGKMKKSIISKIIVLGLIYLSIMAFLIIIFMEMPK